jgi:DNA polymerase-1
MKGYNIISSKESFEQYLSTVEDLLVFDTETTGLKINSNLLGISLYDTVRNPVFIPTNTYFGQGLSIKDIVDVCNRHFPRLKGIAHNCKYDLIVLKVNGISDINVVADTMIMVHTYNPDLQQNLETRIEEDFGYSKQTFSEIIGKSWEKIDWKKDVKNGIIKLEQLAEYACEDVFYTYELYKKYKVLLEKDNLQKVHEKIEIPIAYVLRDMFIDGVYVDVDLLHSMGERVEKELSNLMKKIHDEAGCVFNINSSKQKAEVLFDKLRLPCNKQTKKGARATDTAVLEELAEKGYAIAKYMVEYSELQKLNSGYIQAIPRMVDADGRLRCNFNSCGTKTGRFSSNNPNLQNQPNNNKFPVRAAFRAPQGYKLIVLDYSQIELRMMGHASQDKLFTKAFFDKVDIHQKVANDLGIDRKGGKTINFAVLYGLGPENLSKKLNISVERAKQIIKSYYDTYTGYASWKERTENFAKRNGYVRNLFGRIRRLPDAFSDNKALYFGALRRSVNTIIQGSSADLIKLAMIAIHREFKKRNLDARLLLQVHDELVAEAHESCAVEAYEIMVHLMENVVPLTVPIVAEGLICDTWADAKDDNYENQYEKLKYKNVNTVQTWLIN